MADEQFLISGDQIATYSSATTSYPASSGYTAVVTYNDIDPLGTESDRYFLVRTTGLDDTVATGDLFSVYTAVDDGAGGYTLGTIVYAISQADTTTHTGVTTSDSYAALGMYYGDNLLLNLDGFDGATEFEASTATDSAGTDGELQLTEITAANPDSVPCFTLGTLISTLRGDVPIEDLNINDKVITRDHGPQILRYISRTRIQLTGTNEHLRPVRVRKGSLGVDLPSADVTLSPQHRVLIETWECEVLLGHKQMLCPVKHLVNNSSVHFDQSNDSVDYFHLHFDRHEIVKSSNMWSESFFSNTQCLSGTDRAQRDELLAIFPNLHTAPKREIARPVAKASEAALLLPNLIQ
jgi:hypothetical protein